MSLSTIILTLNEEKYIRNCINSARSISDEVLVIDSGSSDKTCEIAKSMGAKVIHKDFLDFSSQRNFAETCAKGEWVLFLDADEVLKKDLAKEIKKAIKNKKCLAYSIPRENVIFGKLIRYTRWQSELDRHIWLYKKGSGQWQGNIHEEFFTKSKVCKLKNAKIHYQYENVGEFLAMMNKYSDMEAESLNKKGVRFSLIKMIFQVKYNFFVRYFYRLGFLDGWRGFVLSFLMAVYHLELWIKLWHLNQTD